ncbi:Tyrosinase P [Psilocybe cubensis]|uniref:Tyrosinase P n=2 Tax=Psilocybe cubensis TaxID=181762 RepID=A0ACB8HCS0_PSICU|nr:Tyrosinase P [Psilocybe cubensis]KAH9484984.1 Tyrosinase P [Psilocybe cubensis]
MLSTTSIIFAIVLFVNSFCTPALARRYPCDDILVRKEWRNMFNDEKAEYIKAVQCLQDQPAVDPAYPEAESRFDEFQAHYMKQADTVHNLGQFLPWHRHFIRTFENALRNECGYKGATPYWDWSQDADSNSSISASPIFDSVTGFGGDGKSGTYTLPANDMKDKEIRPSAFKGCVDNGPFADYTLHVGPGKLRTSHCLTRSISDGAKKFMSSSAVSTLSKSSTFEVFRTQLEAVSDDGHVMIGGEMSSPYSSPGDPLFYLHHANIDRIWWNWQQLAPATRFFTVTGPATKTPPVHEVGVDYVLNMGSLGLSVPIRDTLDLLSKPNCYTYL